MLTVLCTISVAEPSDGSYVVIWLTPDAESGRQPENRKLVEIESAECSAPKPARHECRLKSVEIAQRDEFQHPCFIGRNVRLNKFTLRSSRENVAGISQGLPTERAVQRRERTERTACSLRNAGL